MNFEYISIDKENIPYRFEIELGIEVFEIEVRYNEVFDHFTLDVFRSGEALIYGEKLVYGVPLFKDYLDARFPGPRIIPIDPSGNETQVTFENLNETVFLVLDNGA